MVASSPPPERVATPPPTTLPSSAAAVPSRGAWAWAAPAARARAKRGANAVLLRVMGPSSTFPVEVLRGMSRARRRDHRGRRAWWPGLLLSAPDHLNPLPARPHRTNDIRGGGSGRGMVGGGLGRAGGGRRSAAPLPPGGRALPALPRRPARGGHPPAGGRGGAARQRGAEGR